MTQVNRAALLSSLIGATLWAAAAQAAETAAAPPASATAQTAAAPAATTWDAALLGGKVKLDFRYRFEDVDQEGFVDDAYASTLRTRLGYTTAEWNGLSAMLEAANVLVVGQYSLYNSTTNGVTDRPTVADPRYTEFNQAWLQFKYGSFTGIGGRQIINLDNQRFVGNVAWRQNDQTFDAVTVKLGAIPRTQLFYSWVGNVNRIYGPDNGEYPGNLTGSTSLLNAKVDLGPVGTVSLFGYWLDFDDKQCCLLSRSQNLSSASYGFYYTGSYKFSETTKLNWTGSWATQSDYGDSTLDYDADYYLLEGGLNIRNFGLKVGYEVLGGNDYWRSDTTGFQTPLATLHIFQGWADKFLSTPTAGVQDFYVGGSANFGKWAMQLVYHDFGTDAKALDTASHTLSSYGNEWDASVGYKFSTRYDVLLKYANYSADGGVPGVQGSDTTKTWVQFTAAF